MAQVRWIRNIVVGAVAASGSFLVGVLFLDDWAIRAAVLTGAFLFLLFSALDYAAARHGRASDQD